MMLHSIPLKNITLDDAFWSERVNLVRSETIPYQWEAMNDRLPDTEPSHCIANLRIAAGRATGEFYGFVFQDSDLAKWLEAVGYSLGTHPDPKLEALADEVIDLVAAAQQPDGYLNSYFTVKAPHQRWKNLREGHELYCAGHMIEAAVAYYEATGKRKLLDVAAKFADLICDVFGPGDGKLHGYPGHQEIELALVKLCKVTGERKYLDMAAYFINARGVGENYFLRERKEPGFESIFADQRDEYDISYSQSHLPVREQTKAAGHAVRAVYMYCAMADLAGELRDDSLRKACETLWDNIVTKQMYITGGIGSSGFLERFTTDYDLSNEVTYAESCASIGLALFGMRMNHLTGQAAYVDTVELALYNTVLAGIALDGKSFFYVNPTDVWPDACMPRTSKAHIKPVRQRWFGCSCCPPNIARTLASLGQYIWAEGDGRLMLNLFVSGTVTTGGGAAVTVKTDFPAKNELTLTTDKTAELAVRIPGYAENYAVSAGYKTENGYALFTLHAGEGVTIRFDAPPRFLRANPEVRADAGRVAVKRGPMVYCLEETDNGGNLSALSVDTGKPLVEEAAGLPGGLPVIQASGKRVRPWRDGALYGERAPEYDDVTLVAAPYAFWGNRSPGGEMSVWIREL